MQFNVTTTSFNNPGGFLVIDGVNGAGKSTLIGKISDYLTAKGKDVKLTREPGCATGIGPAVREILLTRDSYSISPLGELFLFAADRAEHVSQLIQPALAEKKVVISDRYYYSTTAFQGYGRGLDLEVVQSINSTAVQGVLPDLAVFLDLDPEEGLRRAAQRQATAPDTDSFESEKIEFHRRLRDGFLKIAESCVEPVLVVDASPSPDEVFNQVLSALDKWLAAL